MNTAPPAATINLCIKTALLKDDALTLAQFSYPHLRKRVWRAEQIGANQWQVFVSAEDCKSTRPPGRGKREIAAEPAPQGQTRLL